MVMMTDFRRQSTDKTKTFNQTIYSNPIRNAFFLCVSLLLLWLTWLRPPNTNPNRTTNKRRSKRTRTNGARRNGTNGTDRPTVNAKRWQNFEQAAGNRNETRKPFECAEPTRRFTRLSHTHSNTKHPPIHTTSIPLKHFLQLFTFPVCGVEYARTHTRAVNS